LGVVSFPRKRESRLDYYPFNLRIFIKSLLSNPDRQDILVLPIAL